MIHPFAGRPDAPGPEQCLQPEHDARGVLDQVLIAPGQLLQRRPVRAAVIHRAQTAAAQPLGQRIDVDLVPLVALLPLPPPIAHDDAIHERREQIVQPLRLGPFLKDDVDRAPHAAEELHDRWCLRRQDAPRDHAPAVFPDRGQGGCLMHVQRHMFGAAFHESRSLLGSMGLGRLHGSNKGRALNMR